MRYLNYLSPLLATSKKGDSASLYLYLFMFYVSVRIAARCKVTTFVR